MESKTAHAVHAIDTRVAATVPVIMDRWRDKLQYSDSHITSSGSVVADQAIFTFSPSCSISFDSSYRDWGSDCMIMARSLEEAHHAHAVLVNTFGTPQLAHNPELPVFHILALEHNQIRAHKTPLARSPDLTPETMDLSYGEGFNQWAQHLLSIFASHPSSLTLLQGPPGTGKTSFLRWLIGQGREKADFYFVPVTCIDLLSNPNLTDFWLKECAYSDRSKILLIEDAETLLMKRGSENGHWVGNLLNITDGIMGDAMRFHIVCTMNCSFSDIDPALLRRGRLAARWVLQPLDRKKAEKLAALLGKDCPKEESVTLSDIHSPPIQGEVTSSPSIGFHQGN